MTSSDCARWRLIATIVGLTLVIDQATKVWAVSQLDNRRIGVLPTVDLYLTRNSGFSFGTGSDFGPLVGIAVTFIIAVLLVRLWRERQPRRVVLLAAITGGALGNLIDRLIRTDGGWPLTGEVVDFIDVSWYAVFNVADAVLVVAVVVFIITEYLEQRRLAHEA